ncbi:M20 aminoacylase family protein [Eleftheria terrae]|uniref:M20 aminoacylase family protein n=1 Tax=Eleftheria terrae TaxID=1597781 RepID=UPI00263BE431|nr:M20 aminoacylase family protein [Eleftheria terrae]WKB54901.1 M20 family metallopeptidase [Eleftheria terrae]
MRALSHGAVNGVFGHIARFHPELTAFRRDLHAHPELGFEEVRTAARVVEALKLTRVDEVHTGIAKTGVVGVIHGREHDSGRSIALRADMDALPMREENDFAWRSGKSGLMHGCGHDGHTAMLVGAARYLAETRRFNGTVYLIFQPGEEGYAGAKAMIADGLFERFPAQSVYAMHNWPHLPAGQVGVSPGPMMAAADRIEITISGKGGHGAHPHLAIDPVLVAAHIITAAQSLVSRNASPFDNAVVSICAMQGGDVGAMSVIPRQVKLVGTVRTFRPQVQDMIEERLGRMVESIAMGLGASASLDYQRVYPATVNSAAEAAFAAQVAESLLGPEHVLRDMAPSMGAEDFSFMLQVKPGAYLRVGQGRDANDPGCFLHSGRYDFNDDILPLGSALFASLAEQGLPLNPGGIPA